MLLATRRQAGGATDSEGTVVGINTDRGFTNHEHLEELGLIHMTGRVYDPALGRFMSADPNIQAPDNIQSYNRYAYVFNSPLTLADPSGYFSLGGFVGSIFGGIRSGTSSIWQTVKDLKQPIATIGCTVYTGSAGACAALVTKISGGSWNQALKAGLLADATQSAFYMVGTSFPGAGQGGATAASVFQNTVGHAAVGCVSSMLGGGNCGSGALSAGIAAAFGNYNNGGNITQSGYSNNFYIGVVQNAIIGGVGAALGGGKFGNGAVTASFGYLFNCVAHECWKQGALGAAKAVGGGLTVSTGAAICTSLAGCALGPPMASFGASDALQGGSMFFDAVQGISSQGFNLIKTGFQLATPEWGGAAYEGTSLALNVGAIGAKVPLIVGASDGINRVKSMFDVTVSRWDNARVILGNVVDQSINRLMLTGSAIGKAFGFGKEANAAGNGP